VEKDMFKSIFAKYITAVTVIVLINFCLMVSVITSIIANESSEQRMLDVQHMSSLAADVVGHGYHEDRYSDLAAFLSESDDIGYAIDRVTQDDAGISVFIAEMDGTLLLSSDGFGEIAQTLANDTAFWQNMMAQLNEDSSYSESISLPAFGYERQFVYAEFIQNETGENIGISFSCASGKSAEKLVSATTQAVVLACLWIMIAILIAVYFITERTVEPIKRMSVASKNYAKGKFDTRIEVIGRDEVAELSVAFNNMANELDMLEQKRNQFISDVSHELRSPMMSILGFVEGVRSGSVPKEKEGYYLDLTASEIKRLSRLVADLLDVSRLEMGEKKLNFAKCNLCETARLVLISLEKQINDKKLSIEFEAQKDSLFINADADALHRVIYNLTENAIKFSHEGAVVRIKLLEGKNKEHVFEVYNEGVGISAEDLPNVFDRFYKSDKSRGQDKRGVGLGLYFVKTIVTAHGGDVSVTSEEGKYCCFTVRFPKYSDK